MGKGREMDHIGIKPGKDGKGRPAYTVSHRPKMKPGKGGSMPYEEPQETIHPSKHAALAHVRQLMDSHEQAMGAPDGDADDQPAGAKHPLGRAFGRGAAVSSGGDY